jgi:colanic acid/amylovoran biosynthesis glycosyltransferase
MKAIITPSTLFYFYWADKSSALCPFLKKEFPSNKSVTRFHGTDLYETKTPGYMPFREELLLNLDLAVFISSNGKEYLIKKYPSIRLNTFISRLGVLDNGDGIPSTDGLLRIVTCSNMVRIKRLDILIEGLKLLDFEVEWTHLGDGDLMSRLKKLSEELPANVRARFLGFLQNSDVIQYYQENHVDLFINVSEYEGLPVSIMEAISFGIPVIASAVGGIPEIVNKHNGILIPAKTAPFGIARAIIRFINLSENEKLKMRKAAKSHWRNYFDANVNYPSFCERIKSVLHDQKS